METIEVNYKELYEQALKHLCTLFATRNSFSPRVYDAMLDSIDELTDLRTEEIENLHQEISKFIYQHAGSSPGRGAKFYFYSSLTV